MNKELKQHIIDTLKKDIRYDGRELLQYRPVKLEYGISKTAHGSARVKLGNTEVVVGVKLNVEEPYPDTADEGSLVVGAEFLPLSSPDFEAGPPEMPAIELARVIDRGIRESGAIDVKKLCIKKGEKVWVVYIDICTINVDGNLFDASGLATIAALTDTKFPKYEDGELNYSELTKEPLPIKKLPIAVTVFKIGDKFIVDPTPEEEEIMDARLTVTTTKAGTISAMQKGGKSAISFEEIDKMIDIAIEKAKELRTYLR